MSGIKLFVGLGNPGDKYEKTRHNAGFWWIDAIAAQTNSRLTADAKMFGLVGKLNPAQDKWLLKPTTFMNLSGKAVAALANYYKISPAEILVIHDELDLPAGSSKLKLGGGHGGHNGLKDIIAALGNNPNFVRLRLGIGHPGVAAQVANFVLKRAPAAEQELIEKSITKATDCMPDAIAGDWNKAMKNLHTQ